MYVPLSVEIYQVLKHLIPHQEIGYFDVILAFVFRKKQWNFVYQPWELIWESLYILYKVDTASSKDHAFNLSRGKNDLKRRQNQFAKLSFKHACFFDDLVLIVTKLLLIEVVWRASERIWILWNHLKDVSFAMFLL